MSVEIAKMGVCRRCLQYDEDCECCPECREVDHHEHGCGAAQTRPSMVRSLGRQTARGLGPSRSQVRAVFVVSKDVTGLESTGRVEVLR